MGMVEPSTNKRIATELAARIRAVGVAAGLSRKGPAQSAMSRRRLAGMLTNSRRSIPKGVWGSPEAARRALAEEVETMADTLADVVDQAGALDLAIPPPVANGVLDLRGFRRFGFALCAVIVA